MNQEERAYIKDVAMQFLRELQDDRKTFVKSAEVEILTLKQNYLRTAEKDYLTLKELDELFGELKQNILVPFIDRSTMNISVKGVRRIRALLSYGEDGKILFLDDEGEQKEIKVEKREIKREDKLDNVIQELTTKRREKILKRVETGLTPILENLKKILSSSVDTVSSSTDADKFVLIEEETGEPVEVSEISGLKSIFEKLESWGPTLDALLTQLGTLGSDIRLKTEHDKKAVTGKSQEEITNQLATVEQQLQEMAESIRFSVKMVEEADVDSRAKSNTINTSQTIEKTLDKALSELGAIDGELSELASIEGKLAETSPDDQESLGQALSELGAIDGELIASIEGEPEEVSDLKRKISVLQTELRRQNLLLEHTRNVLSSNPKYAALFILEELGNMPLASLAKSVGTSSIALRSLLTEFVERGLLQIDGEDSNAIVGLVFGTPQEQFKRL